MKKNKKDNFGKDKLFCIPVPPILLLVNLGVAGLLALTIIIYSVYLFASYLKRNKKDDFFNNKKKTLIWVVPALIYLISVYFLGKNFYLYILTPIIFSVSILITAYLGAKKGIIKRSKKLNIVAIIVLVLSLSLFGVKAFYEPELIEPDVADEYIIIPNPVGGCQPSLY